MFSNYMADLSNNNDSFFAKQYAHAGHVAIGLKATEGTTFVDFRHRGWSLNAGLVHLAIFHYHFARPDLGNAPHEEAAHFLDIALPLAGPRDYLVLDLERATPQGWAHDPAWSRDFDDYVRAHSRFYTILYGSKSTLAGSDQWLVGAPRRIWEADWSGDRDFAPKGYAVVLRQFTDGTFGPEPHELPGCGVGDVSRIEPEMMRAIMAKRS